MAHTSFSHENHNDDRLLQQPRALRRLGRLLKLLTRHPAVRGNSSLCEPAQQEVRMAQLLFPHDYQDDARLNRIFSDRARLPRFLRGLHERLTGLPDPRQPARATTPLRVLAADIGWLAGFSATAAAGAAIAHADPLSVTGPLAALISAYASLGVVGRLRRLVVGHAHEAAHGVIAAFYRERGVAKARARSLNEWVLDIGTALTLTRNGLDYRRSHGPHHDTDKLGTLRDPDGMDLHSWRLWRGLGIRSLRLELLLTALDPFWHAGMIWARLKSNFATGRRSRRLMALPPLLLVVASAAVLPLPVWLMAIGLPWTVGYNIAALLQVVTEHPYAQSGAANDHAAHAARNWDRVPVDPLPASDLTGFAKARAWTVFTARLLALHIPARLAVLDSSMIAHAWHHMAWPTGHRFFDWWETPRRELEARRAGTLPRAAATRVLFGLGEAIALQAVQFAKAQAAEAATTDAEPGEQDGSGI